MANWQISLGNLAERSAIDAVAVSPAVSDTLLPLSNLATGYPDEEASFTWRADGNYGVTVNLNLLANSSELTDAPSGWRDLLLMFAGTPGLSSDPPDWNTYASRTALRAFRPVYQEVDVMPGENMTIAAGIYLPANSTATAVQLRVVNTTTGLGWSGANNAWESAGIVESQAVDDTWEDISEAIIFDTNCADRCKYRVSVEPVANSYDANTYVYVSGPSLYGEADFVALIGHNLPASATVTFGNFTIVTTETPSAWDTLNSAEYILEANLTIAVGTNQPRPKIGELWVGKLTTLTRGVDPDIQVREGDIGQLRVMGAGGRQEVVTDLRIPVSSIGLKVRTFTDDQWEDWRHKVTRGTRFGADPIVIVPPSQFQGTRLIHGRVGQIIGTAHKDNYWREFTVEVAESPFSQN